MHELERGRNAAALVVHAEAVGIVLGSTALMPLFHDVLARLREFGEIRARGMLEGIAHGSEV